MIQLSILICSLSQRAKELGRLMDCLTKIPVPESEVEILVDQDNGTKKIGRKRNELLLRASGKYVVFVDDDDTVSQYYTSKILQAVQSGPDCCGIEGIITVNGTNPKRFIHSLKYKEWFQDGNVYYRTPNHLCPVKMELASQIKFPELNFGEDHDFSKGLLPLLKTEVFICGPIYNYLYIPKNRPKDEPIPNIKRRPR